MGREGFKFEESKGKEIKQPKKEAAEFVLAPEFRNYLQYVLMRKMYEREPNDSEILSWIADYSKDVSDIIDNPANIEIRELVQRDEYEEAADKVLEILNQKGFGKAA